MKKTIFLMAAAILACSACFSQSNKSDSAAEKPAKVSAQAPKAQQYFILLSQNDLVTLFDFVTNADIYSDKGRSLYLDFLKKHTFMLPAQGDAPAAAAGSPKLKPKKKP